ncbi:MAG: nuclear transport factor 2 family protein [Thermoguttaceae bacterium]
MSRISITTITVILGLISTISARAVDTDPSAASHPVIDQVFAKYEKAFNAGDAKAIGALWKSDGEFIDPLGDKIVGREAIEKLFQDFFARTPGEKLSIKVLSIKEEEEGRVVVAEIVPEVSPPLPGRIGSNKATIVLVRSGENWLIEGVKERLHVPAAYEHLKALEWLVGSWSTQAPSSAQSDKANQISINSTCQWTANKSFLTRTFSTHTQQLELQGTEIIGWDPQAKSIRSWLFESTGGFTESAWKPDGKQWIIEMKGVLASGDTVSSTTTLTKVDDNTLTIQLQKRLRGGKPQSDVAAITIHRVNSSALPNPEP